MHEICIVEWICNIFVIIYGYLQAKLRVIRAEFVFGVAGHEIICRSLIHPC